MPIRKHFSIFGIVFLLICIGLCGCEEKDNMVFGTGEIQYINLEGGFYGIVSDDGKHYDPINLSTVFQEDGLRVNFVLRILRNQTSIHMWGTVVEILQIEKLEITPTGQLLNYYGCKETNNISQECIEYDYDGENILLLKHVNSVFNCCPNITANVTVNNYNITIEEIEISGECNCICLFDLDYEIQDLHPGEYAITVIVPYIREDEEKLEFKVNLSSTPSGSYCVERHRHPWE